MVENAYLLAHKKFRRVHPKGYIFYDIPEQVLVYEEFYKCSLLVWATVHHKNRIPNDNRIENLEAMTKQQHRIMHNKERLGKHCQVLRVCHLCKKTTTRLVTPSPRSLNRTPFRAWYKHNDGWLCHACYHKYKRPDN